MLEISTPRKRSELNNWDTHLKLATRGSGEKHIIEASDWPQPTLSKHVKKSLLVFENVCYLENQSQHVLYNCSNNVGCPLAIRHVTLVK
jgi:hypothetical protein